MDPFDDHYSAFQDACLHLGIDLPEGFRRLMALFYEELVRANERLNLTRITGVEAFLFKHLLDALALRPYLPGPFKSLCDVGSGCGVPGVVLAAAAAPARCVLVERTRKKAVFLEALVERLGLTAQVVARHSQEYRPQQGFDLVTARALGPVAKTLEACAHLVAPGGLSALYLGPSADAGRAQAEATARAVSLVNPRWEAYSLPRVGSRRLLLLQKDA